VPWRDVLHDGPVPAGLPLEALSEVRARHIAAVGMAGSDVGAREQVQRDFARRDAALRRALAAGGASLWFEHDLYDQLQLLQLLDAFATAGVRPRLAQLDADYLGRLEPDAVRALAGRIREVGDAELALAKRAWAAFRAPEPTAFAALLDEDTSAMPHLAPAVRRMLEEYPDARSGLARTERTALEALTVEPRTIGDLFAEVARREERTWLGDASFAGYLAALAAGDAPLLRAVDDGALGVPYVDALPRFMSRRVALTPLGERVIAGDADRIAEHGIDRWIGGVHLEGRAVAWRWDRAEGRLSP
jgi:hypothetical protein